jgi:hypothetical protein
MHKPITRPLHLIITTTFTISLSRLKKNPGLTI